MAKPVLHIIDDDEEICSEISDALHAAGYICSWATCPERLAGPDGREPDVLLLDLSMPNGDGFQVIRRLAQEKHQPHLIVASGHEERIIRAAVRCARDAGLSVLGALEKPYSIRSLMALIDRPVTAAARLPGGQKASCRLAPKAIATPTARTGNSCWKSNGPSKTVLMLRKKEPSQIPGHNRSPRIRRAQRATPDAGQIMVA